MSYDDVVRLLNEISKENEILKCKVNGLKSELNIWKEDGNEHIREINKLFEENKQLKKELTKFKEREEHIRDVKREELDRVFKMSIYEIVEAFEYYQKRIKELEKVMLND